MHTKPTLIPFRQLKVIKVDFINGCCLFLNRETSPSRKLIFYWFWITRILFTFNSFYVKTIIHFIPDHSHCVIIAVEILSFAVNVISSLVILKSIKNIIRNANHPLVRSFFKITMLQISGKINIPNGLFFNLIKPFFGYG